MPARCVSTAIRPVDEEGRALGLVTLDRPDSLNALDGEMVDGLVAAVEELSADPRVRVIALTGAGRAFCAGGDLKAYERLLDEPDALLRYRTRVRGLFQLLRHTPKPCLALVNGVAVAGGLELAIACDVVFAATTARFGDGHQRYGLIGGGGVLARLAAVVGPLRARDLVFSARLIDADEAQRWGIASRVVSAALLLEEGEAFARDVAQYSPAALARAKDVLERIADEAPGAEAAALLEGEAVGEHLRSADVREGLRAFAEKRRPAFAPAPDA